MTSKEVNVVTGAFGYTGKYITRRLLALGKSVRTLTGRSGRHSPFGEEVKAFPFNFDKPGELAKTLEGAATLYNTYWVRFPHGKVDYDLAVKNTRALIKAAREAGVRRVVHVSITCASKDSPLPYFRGKGLLEEFIIDSGLTYAIIRPTVIFGKEDILINNIAWFLRKYPVFAVPGNGDYRLQPIFVEDMAEITVKAGQETGNMILDAVGPETYTFNELVRLITEKTGSKSRIIHLGPDLTLYLTGILSKVVKDVVLTRDEVRGLMANLLVSEKPPLGKTLLSRWLEENSAKLGSGYSSELDRHYR